VKRMFPAAVFLAALPLYAAHIPSGTEMAVRLTTRVASEAPAPAAAVTAVVIAPVVADGRIVILPGAELNGEVKQAKAAADKDAAELQIVFNSIHRGALRVPLTAVVSHVDNARESVNAEGIIVGVAPDQTPGARLNQGISKLQQNDRLAALAGILNAAKQELKIEDPNPNIDYDSGVELSVRVTQPLEWNDPPSAAIVLAAFPNEDGLPALVNRQPFRTATEQNQKPSDITGLMFVATEEELKQAFAKAGWFSAERLTTKSKLETARALIEARGYNEGPMSVLMLDGRAPDLTFEKGNDTYAARHHLRIFRRPDTYDGKPVWVCSATHDTGIDFSERDRTFIHKIDSNIDNERAKVINDLLFAGAVRSLALVDRPDLPASLSNATGDALRTDGRMAVLLLQ
jgi:hypothetical protein